MKRWEIRALWHGYYMGYSIAGGPNGWIRKPKLLNASWKSLGYFLGFQDGETYAQTPKEPQLIERAEAIKTAFLANPEAFRGRLAS